MVLIGFHEKIKGNIHEILNMGKTVCNPSHVNIEILNQIEYYHQMEGRMEEHAKRHLNNIIVQLLVI